MNSCSAAISAPPLAFWLGELAFRLGGLFGVYVLSQACIVTAFWAVFTLGRSVVGTRHAVLGILLMAGVAVFTVPSPEFGPAILAAPFWALALLHYWRAVGQSQRGAWFLLGVDLGLLLLTSYIGAVPGGAADRLYARHPARPARADCVPSPGSACCCSPSWCFRMPPGFIARATS